METVKLMDLWAIEYSRQQKSFHVYQVREMIENNLRLFSKPPEIQTPDFLPLAFAESREEANRLVDKLRAQQG